METEIEIRNLEQEISDLKLRGYNSERGRNWNNKELRRLRMKVANLRGTHTQEEWSSLVSEFGGRCVKCFVVSNIEKDHIIPLYQGGSNHISNLQPLCRVCNARKGPDSKNWVAIRRGEI